MKSKGPDDTQVNAVAGFGHQIMREYWEYICVSKINKSYSELVDEIEKENDEGSQKKY